MAKERLLGKGRADKTAPGLIHKENGDQPLPLAHIRSDSAADGDPPRVYNMGQGQGLVTIFRYFDLNLN